MIVVQYTVLAIFFLLELSVLVVFSYWGFHIKNNLILKIILGIGTPILVAIIWGTFIAPKASLPVSIPVRILLQLIIFGLATAMLYYLGKGKLAIIFGIVLLLEMIFIYLMKI
jgi:hypothetical protein